LFPDVGGIRLTTKGVYAYERYLYTDRPSADAHQTWTSGTVVRVSVERGKVTIEHGPIKNLEMMAMTMPFTVADSSLLEGLAAGDKIEFVAGKNGDELVVEALRRPAS